MSRYAERVAPVPVKTKAPLAARQQSRPVPTPLSHILQLRAAESAKAAAAPSAPDRAGLPAGLKAGVELLSGLAMDDVRVHRNSSEPAKLGAAAYTQGGEIHVGPGQDRHLAHEAWHVVQQKQGRVKPSLQMKGVAINNDDALEREADRLGAQALRAGADGPAASAPPRAPAVAASGTRQLKTLAAPNGVTAIAAPALVYFNSGAHDINILWRTAVHEAATRPALLTTIAQEAGTLAATIDGLAAAGWTPNANNAGSNDIDTVDPVRVRFRGRYGVHPNWRNLNLDYHYGSKWAGYVVHVYDTGGGGIDKEMHDRESNIPITADEYSSTHDIPHQAPNWALEQTHGKHAADAVTKIAGEGARWNVIAANAGKVRNDTKIFTNQRSDGALTAGVRYVLFQDLWKSWDLTFNKAWGISNNALAAVLKGPSISTGTAQGAVTVNVATAQSSDMAHAVDVSVDNPPPQSDQQLAATTMAFLHYKKNDPSIVKSQRSLADEIAAARLAVQARATHKGVEGYLGGDVFAFLCSWGPNAVLGGVAGYTYDQAKTASFSYPAYREAAAVELARNQASTPANLRDGQETLATERGRLYTDKFRALVSAMDAYAKKTGIKGLDTKRVAATNYPHQGAAPVSDALQTTVWSDQNVKSLVDPYVATRDARRLKERQDRYEKAPNASKKNDYMKKNLKQAIRTEVEKDPDFA
jgi:hypothetical protein